MPISADETTHKRSLGDTPMRGADIDIGDDDDELTDGPTRTPGTTPTPKSQIIDGGLSLVSLKDYVDHTKDEMRAALRAVEEQQCNMLKVTSPLSATITSSFDGMAKRVETRLALVEAGVSAQEKRVSKLELQVKALSACLGETQEDKPNKPTDALSPDFERIVDPSIIIIRSKGLIAKSKIMESLRGWIQRSNLGEDDFFLQGDPVAKWLVLQIRGDLAYASKKAAEALSALRCLDGSWERFQAAAVDGVSLEAHVSDDKNPYQIKAELALKQIRRDLVSLAPSCKFSLTR